MNESVIYLPEVDSTNLWAKHNLDKFGPIGAVYTTHQTAGRGRLGRSWLDAPHKGLYYTAVIRTDLVQPATLPLFASLAVCDALRERYRIDCQIKWPNDLLLNGKKIVGILTELNASMEQVDYMILGMGINTSFTEEELPEELRGIATSFRMEGIDINRNDLWMSVVEELEAYYEKAVNEGFVSILEEWKTLSVTLGADVEVMLPKGMLAGKAVDIDADGNLLLATADGVERIVAGDVRVRRKHIVNHKEGK